MPSWFPKSGPRRPADGIAAKKKRGDIGDTWWSKRFVQVLESFTDPGRLTRGRSYARSGQVLALEVGPGMVTARVQGSRARPYTVRIGISALTPEQWAKVDEALASKALYVAALLAGEMPHEIEAVFREVHHPLFPVVARDLRSECTCPDAANPCKHIAATYYILAERFDEDPFSILAWRGRAREDLMSALRALRTDAAAPAPEVAEPEPVPVGIEGFWSAAPEALALRFRPDLEGSPTALLGRLGPLPSGGRDLAELLAPSLGILSQKARARALEE